MRDEARCGDEIRMIEHRRATRRAKRSRKRGGANGEQRSRLELAEGLNEERRSGLEPYEASQLTLLQNYLVSDLAVDTFTSDTMKTEVCLPIDLL